MTIPQPPGYQNLTTQDIMNANSNMYYPRRPKSWVPPTIMVSSFSAGYGIPWNLEPNPGLLFFRFVAPLILSAILCCVASFFSFQANKNWRIWSWAAFGFQLVTLISMLLFPVVKIPLPVLILLILSLVILGIGSGLGAEERSEGHRKQ